MSTLEVRAALFSEADQILQLWQVAGENTDRPTDRIEAVHQLLERDPQALLIALEDEQIVGSVIAGWDGWRAHLYRLAVLPDRRRRGVARSLLTAASERLVALGASRLDAMVLEGNDDGQQLWRAAGYSAQSHWRRWVQHVG